MPIDFFKRHHFLWLNPAAIPVDNSSANPLPALTQDWIEHENPVIVRRPCVDEKTGEICVGISFPPSPEKQRFAFEIPASLVERGELPPAWEKCKHLASTTVLEAIHPLQNALAPEGFALRTFGSYAWQTLTGHPYLTSKSDIDLLVFLETGEDWNRFQQAMLPLPTLPLVPRIDLEIVLAGDISFSWREFVATKGKLLFKDNRSAWIGTKDDISKLWNE